MPALESFLMCVYVCVTKPYQWIFEVHQSPVVQGEPPFLEAFCLLQMQTSERNSQT